MTTAFYLSWAVAVIATVMMLTRLHAVHALLYLITSLLAVAVIFYVLGAYFVAALEIIIYAGAIMVFFVFVVMMLNLGDRSAAREKGWLAGRSLIGPAVLLLILLGEIIALLIQGTPTEPAGSPVTARQVGAALYGPYLLGVELASILLLAAVVGAFHLGRKENQPAGGTE